MTCFTTDSFSKNIQTICFSNSTKLPLLVPKAPTVPFLAAKLNEKTYFYDVFIYFLGKNIWQMENWKRGTLWCRIALNSTRRWGTGGRTVNGFTVNLAHKLKVELSWSFQSAVPECCRNQGPWCLLSVVLARPCSSLIFESIDSQKWSHFSDLEILSSDLEHCRRMKLCE